MPKRPIDPSPSSVRGNWVAVACGQHVRHGVSLGICQVNHGKEAPLKRMRPGDRIAVYSPTETLGGHDRLQAFTAFGIVADAPIEQVRMAERFEPFRRKVDWRPVQPAPIGPLRERPGFALAGPAWGAKLRFGVLAVDDASMDMIEAALAPHSP